MGVPGVGGFVDGVDGWRDGGLRGGGVLVVVGWG